MKRTTLRGALLAILLSSVVGTSMLTSSAHGAGLDVAWDECAGSGGTPHAVLDCGFNDVRALLATFTPGVDVPAFAIMTARLDIQADAAVLPPFWDFQSIPTNPGGCNAAYVLDNDPPSGLCTGIAWAWTVGFNCGGEIGNHYDFTRDSPGRGHFDVTWVTGCERRAAGLVAGTTYFGFVMWLYSALSDACPGCSTPATIVLSEVALHLDAGTPPIVIDGPGGYSNCVTANGTGVPCSATPMRRNTWGALKSLYR